MKKIFRFSALIITGLLLSFPSHAKDYLYDFDYGALIYVSAGKNVCKNLNVQVQADFWLNDNFKGYERFMPSATLTYTVIPKYLKAMAYYAYFNQEGKSGKKDVHQHRYQVGLTGSYATPHLNFSLCSKFEQTHKDGIPNNKWRNQVKITGTIAQENPWKPFVSVEIFEAMNSMNPTGTVGIERIRYEAGTNYAVNKLISLEMKLRAERLTIKKQLYSSVGVGVKFNL